MALSVTLDTARVACTASIDGFVGAVETFTEHELLGSSRCHGWCRLDVVTHVLDGWQEMLGGMVSPVDDEPTVDAASYWSAFAAEYATDDPIPVLMYQRRRTSTYARPSKAILQLRDVARAVRRGVDSIEDRTYLWQDHVFTAGDSLTTWAVENAVHQLDLLSDEPAPASALALARATIEGLLGEPIPAEWDDLEAVLIGTGRRPVPAAAGALANRLPVLG